MRNSGFTIIELLIASLLVAIVMVFTMETFTVNNRNYIKIDSVVDTQQSVRAIASVLERDLRHAGMMVPEIVAACGIDRTTAPDLLYVSDYTAVNPADAIGVFDGALVQGAVSQVNANPSSPPLTTLTLDTLVMEPDTPDPSYDTDGNGVNDSDFRVNGGVIVADSFRHQDDHDPDQDQCARQFDWCLCVGRGSGPRISHRFREALPQQPPPVRWRRRPAAHVFPGCEWKRRGRCR
jgi:prepilin-type N-terminal cleavage/methylation domain-containing protein